MVLGYYSYSYLSHFPSTTIFGYLFVDFLMTEYIRIFVCKFLKFKFILIFSTNLILIFACLCFMNNVNLGLIYASNKYPG